MRHLMALLLTVLAALGTPGVARAWHPAPSAIEVLNSTPHEVRVTIDGAFRGPIRGGDQRGFGVWPGAHQVQVATPDGRGLLMDVRVDVRPGTTPRVVVLPPAVKLTLHNDGDAPLFVQIDNDRPLWMLPGALHVTERLVGPVRVSTSLYTWEGLVPLETRVVHLLPGRPAREAIGFQARGLVGAVTLTNLERTPVTVWLDGQHLTTLRPRETRTLDVAPGRHLVAVIDASGRLLYQSPVTLGPRTAYDVTFQGGVTVLPQRPAGPPVAWAR